MRLSIALRVAQLSQETIALSVDESPRLTSLQTPDAIHAHLLKMRTPHPRLGEFAMIWDYYPLAQKVSSVKLDAMAFRMRTTDLSCLLVLKWDGEVKDEEVQVKAHQ